MRTVSTSHSSRYPIMGSERGIALLVVLWFLVILTAIVFSFSFLARTETHATLLFVQSVEERLLAEAGVERAIAEILRRSVFQAGQAIPEAEEAVKVNGTLYKGTLGDGIYTYSILDESGKINLNLLGDASGVILGNLLVNNGVPKEEADTIVDAVLDWKDPDELVRLHGAESEYYSSLPEPYQSKNAPFDSVEELLMVKGVTPGILYGSKEKPGIFDFLTVYTSTQTINVNTAPREVLAALPGMGTGAVDAIISARAIPQGLQAADLQSIVGDAYALMTPYVGVSGSNTYSIEATGYKKNAKQGLMIKAAVTIEGTGKRRYVYYKSPAGTKKPKDEGT